MRPAFTLIELILAVSVVVVITAVAIPSFSTLNRGNDWSSSVQKITGCLQGAQRRAASPDISSSAANGSTPRYVGADLSLDAQGNLVCQDLVFSDIPSQAIDLATLTVDMGQAGTVIGDPVRVPAISSMPVSFVGPSPAYSFATPARLRLYFSAAQSGNPIAIVACDSAGTCRGGIAGPDPSQILVKITLTGNPVSLKSVLSVPALGVISSS